MSGGTFDHRNHVLTDIADTIEAHADNCARGFVDGYGTRHSCREDTLDKMLRTVAELRVLERRIHLLDYWMAGDTGEDNVNRLWAGCDAVK